MVLGQCKAKDTKDIRCKPKYNYTHTQCAYNLCSANHTSADKAVYLEQNSVQIGRIVWSCLTFEDTIPQQADI